MEHPESTASISENTGALTNIRAPENILARPPRTLQGYDNLSSWVEEAIWGHRLWYRQTPWLLFLEFLNIAEAASRSGAAFSQTYPSPVNSYRLFQRLPFRNLIFNNESLANINEASVADSVKWDTWVSDMNRDCEPNSGLNFDYLRSRFAKFSDFAITIQLLRQTAIEPNANRSWSSRFVFPFGASSLYEDLTVSNGKTERGANHFGRTGDLLYMMLSRSSRASELKQEFAARLSTASIPIKMIEKLLPEEPTASLSPDRKGGYLPYKKHPTYERLAGDWLSILRLGLPGQDSYAHLVALGAFHVLIYQMETAAAWLDGKSPAFVCEVIGPKTQFIRQRATRSFIDNDGLCWAAVERVASDFMEGPLWQAAVDSPALVTDRERVDAAVKLLEEHLWMDSQDLNQCGVIETLKRVVIDKLRDKIDNNQSMLHSTYGRNCGLVSRRGARSYRYAPTDSLLKTLVLANVSKRMEINEFLSLLFSRYRMIFGPDEARGCLNEIDYDETAFQKNRERLEDRLRSMGLVNRLSDGCAYIKNPLI